MKIYWLSLLMILNLNALKLDRVILATDTHENYIQFWPIVAKVWKEVVGVTPTLALIADESVAIDETCGDVIRFDPIPGVPTSLQAQAIRLLLPAYFPADGCIISDIDMIPLQKSYFVDSIEYIPDDRFIIYRDGAYEWMAYPRYPMCYVAAKGSVFKELFDIQALGDIPKIIQQWHKKSLGWNTDELMLYAYVSTWGAKTKRVIKLGHGTFGRVDRLDWQFDCKKVRSHAYIDAHMPRPYEKFKKSIDQLIKGLLDEA